MTTEPETPETESETEMSTPAKKTRKAKATANARTPRAGTKLEIIKRMLNRKNGCTAKEVMAACEWPAVSMPQQAKALGIKLKTQKIGRTTHYWEA